MSRRHGDQCVARFAADEVAVLRQVASEVIGLLSENFDRDDPVVERLFPDVYADDAEQAAEFRRYTEGVLKTSKIDQAAAILAALPGNGGAGGPLGRGGARGGPRGAERRRPPPGNPVGIREPTHPNAEAG